jgi:hypothetical protein
MALDPLTGGLIGGGLSLIGGLFGASGASKQANAERAAAAEARQFQQGAYAEQIANYLASLYGPEQAMQMLPGYIGQDAYNSLFGRDAVAGQSLTETEQRRIADIDRQIADIERQGTRNNVRGMFGTGVTRRPPGSTAAQSGEVERLRGEREALMKKAGGDPGTAGKFNRDSFMKRGPGVMSEMGGLADAFKNQSSQRLTEFDRAMGMLDAEGRNTRQRAEAGYQDETRVLERDASRQLKTANAGSLASLRASGLGGSSLVNSAMTGNQRAVGERLDASLRNVNQAKNQFLTNIDMQNIARQTQQTGARADMANRLDLQGFQASSIIPQAKLNAASGSILNPWLTTNPQQGFVGVSGGGAASQVMGNALGGVGGTLAGISLQQLLNQGK